MEQDNDESSGPPSRPRKSNEHQLRELSSTSLLGEHFLSTTPEPLLSSDGNDDNGNGTSTSTGGNGNGNGGNHNGPAQLGNQNAAEAASADNVDDNISMQRSTNGKPPRAPHCEASTTKTTESNTSHHNALIDTVLVRPQAIHHRSISGLSGPVLDSPKQQPSTTTPRPTMTTAPSSRWETANLSLSDIVSPLESEAETAILKAVEAHRRHQSAATEIMLPNIPHDTVHAFEDPTSWSAPSVMEEEEKKETTSVVNSLPDGNSMATPTRVSAPTGSKQSTSSHAKAGQPSTVAEVSLESTLFGLTAAMRDMHATNHDSAGFVDSSESRRRRIPTEDMDRPTTNNAWEVEAPTHDQDAFVHHANLLFRRNINVPENETLIPTAQSARPAFNMDQNKSTRNLFGGKGDPKKTDEMEDGQDLDIEEGFSTASTNIATGTSRPKRFGRKFAAAVVKNSKQLVGGAQDVSIHTPEVIKRATFNAKEDLEVFKRFLKPRYHSMKVYVKIFLLYVLLPTLGVSTLLFYAFGNPKVSFGCISNSNIPGAKPDCPSLSWFLNFLIIRQAITFSLAKATGIFLIDFLALKTRVVLRLLGPIPTLMFVQSKGWPFQIAVWSIYSLILNSGNNQFAKNWLFYQEGIDMFNAANSAGNITYNDWNSIALWNAIFLGIAVALKRFFVGLYLGQRTYVTYANQLAKVIHQVIVIGQVSLLGRELEMRTTNPTVADSLNLRNKKVHSQFDWSWKGFDGTGLGDDDEKTEGDPVSPNLESENTRSPVSGSQNVEDTVYVDRLDPFGESSGRVKMLELLEAWEEPELDPGKPENISISAILQFRQSLAFMDLSYPFSISFGLADTRAHCVESSQGVYRRLMCYNPKNTSGVLQFDAIASLAKSNDASTEEGEKELVDADKMKDLIRLFRPDRQGNLTMLDFVKSVDAVYKKLRLLRASISSASQIDHATECIVNCFFYFLFFCILLARLKIDPLKFFLSMSSVILAFAFMIGSASAKYFEGILFILVRQPYDIGDRIAISDPTKDTNVDGSSCWYVESVDLYTTTVRSGATNEVATLTNGALASARVINAARSPRALVYLHLKFGVDVPYAKVQLFRKTVEEFVKARPREWLSLSGFRASKVETDLGYIAYVISCQHREAWQNLVPILQSKADLFSYCLEVQKQLDMRYSAPSLPVDLQIKGQNPADSSHNVPVEVPGRSQSNTGTALEGIEALADLFTIRSAT